MKLKSRVRIVIVSIVLLLIAMVAAAMLLFMSLNMLNESLRIRYESRNLADELRQSSDDLTRFVRLYVATGDPKFEQFYWDVLAIRNGERPRPEKYDRIYWDFVAADGKKPQPDGKAVPLQELMKQIGFTEQEFAKLANAQKESDALVRIEEVAMHAMKGLFDDGNGGFTRTGQPDQVMASGLINGAPYQHAKAKIMKPIDEFFQILDDRTLSSTRKNTSQSLLYLAAVIGAGAGVLIAAISMIVIIRGVYRQVGGEPTNIALITEKVADGDLTVDWRNGIKAPTGILASLGKMVKSLRQQTCEIKEAANVLAASASEISASVTQVTSGAQETAASVTQTTATVEEVKQGAHLTSQKTKAVAESSQKGLQLAHVGRKATETVAESMTRINGQMASISDTIVKLSEQSQMIGEITSTVDDIAEQSNLLAVNAAIEAAKAGEHGKGFAVVAQEIKSLAEQSKQATKQVRGILNSIQKATGVAVMATEQGSKAVDQGTKESMNANESIRTLSASFSETVQSAGQIAASTQEQLTGMDQVAMAMESIKAASQQNVASMKQLETAAQTLKDIGHKFTELVGRYKV